MEHTMKRTNVLSMILVTVVLLAACAAPIPVPTVANIMVQGEQVPFEICGESVTWTRPTDGEQKVKWWDNGRYAGDNDEVIKYLWTHDFFVAYGHASSEYDLTNLSGLWTLADNVRSKCIEPDRQDRILKLEKAEVWMLLHRVKAIRRLDTDYYLVVEPVKKGAQFVQFARPEQLVPITFHFVTENGQDVENIVEAESLYWPYPQLTPTRQP
jgi:hypothetical protein